nr:Putative tartrate transporter [Agrobacterium fabrum]
MNSDLETRVLRKITLRIVPFIMLLYFVAFLDRVNIGFAALTMNEDLGFSSTVFGIGAGIFFVGYFLFEVPSNLILNKVGARIWIARVMITWGDRVRPHGVRTGNNKFLCVTLPSRRCRGGLFPGDYPLPELLVSGSPTCGSDSDFHGRSPAFDRPRFADLRSAHGDAWFPRSCRLAVDVPD